MGIDTSSGCLFSTVSRSNWNSEEVFFVEEGNKEKPSDHRREPTTNLSHI